MLIIWSLLQRTALKTAFFNQNWKQIVTVPLLSTLTVIFKRIVVSGLVLIFIGKQSIHLLLQ